MQTLWAATLLFLLSSPCSAAEGIPIGKVIGSSIKGNSTELILEVNRPLVPGKMVYLGSGESAVVNDLLSEKGGLYYYMATIPEKAKIKPGEDVYPEETLKIETKAPLTFFRKLFKSWDVFTSKKKAEITARHGDRALIDRGSLHEVREKDVYEIYDSSGRCKGKLELSGIGDFQSQGPLYNSFLEDRGRDVMKTELGDKAIFIGQRKMFNFHVFGGMRNHKSAIFGNREDAFGGGLLWAITFRDGWGVELLFGGYRRRFGESIRDQTFDVPSLVFPFNPVPTQITSRVKAGVDYIAPVWIRKNLRYPRTISPYLGLGMAFLKADVSWSDLGGNRDFGTIDTKKRQFVPMLGGGIELFPGRFLHPRIEIRYLPGPTMEAKGNFDSFTLKTTSLFYSFALSTSW